MRKKILIIEDEERLMHALNIYLADNFDLLETSDGISGYNTALAMKPDLILLDIILPQLSGTELLRKLRKDEWGKDAKVVIISNLTSKDIEKELRDLGILEYIVKSNISIVDLTDKIKTFVQ